MGIEEVIIDFKRPLELKDLRNILIYIVSKTHFKIDLKNSCADESFYFYGEEQKGPFFSEDPKGAGPLLVSATLNGRETHVFFEVGMNKNERFTHFQYQLPPGEEVIPEKERRVISDVRRYAEEYLSKH
jgi:hypothetical protein